MIVMSRSKLQVTPYRQAAAGRMRTVHAVFLKVHTLQTVPVL